jgi:glycosyltransferase involved in cell wall biosynthesis
MSLSISVVIPYFNGSRFIAEALDSVRSQTLAALEIIVVDDGSRPEEGRALDRVARDCVVIHLPTNRGQSVARNTGIARARGEWIAFLDCDDLWDPRKLELQAAVVAANADCRAVHCGLRSLKVDGSEGVYRKRDVTSDDLLDEFPCPILPSAAMMHRQALIECGLFDQTFRCAEDLDLFLRFTSCHGRFHSVPEPLVIRRVQKDGVSRNIAAYWDEAERVYRGSLSAFADRRRVRGALREVHIDMLLRALYARDRALMWRILRRATRADVPVLPLLGGVIWRAIRERLR